MTIYIDENFKCHASCADGLAPVESAFFEGKCPRYVGGYRYIPAGESWTREDGTVFTGEMIAPAEDIRLLEAAQAAYEEAQAENADALAALEVLGVSP